MKCIHLTKSTVKILRINFLYDTNIQSEQNYLNTLQKIEQVKTMENVKANFIWQNNSF